MHVVVQALSEIEKNSGSGKMVVVGERGKMYLEDNNIPFVSFGGINDEQRYAQAMQLRDYLVSKVLDGSFGGLKIVYPHPISITMQRVQTVAFLPFVPVLSEESATQSASYSDVIFESRPKDIIEYLVYTWIGLKIFEIFGLSRLSEFAARFVHLEESHQRIKEMDGKIRLEYFRARHEIIDRNMRELFAARTLYAS